MEMSDQDLEQRIEHLHYRLTTRSARFAQEHAAGCTVAEAARRAGLSPRRGAPYKVAAQPPVAELVRLLREQARRRAAITTVDAILRFQHLSRRAEEAGDLGVAVTADREAARIANLYPQEGAAAGPSSVVVQVALQLPQRETPPSFLVNAAAPMHALPAPQPQPQPVEMNSDDPLLA